MATWSKRSCGRSNGCNGVRKIMSDKIFAVTVPKWGLSMEEGRVAAWLISEGDTVKLGEEIIEIETTKITNVVEAQFEGILRHIVAQEGETLPVGALLGVVADASTEDVEISAFVDEYQSSLSPVVSQKVEDEGPTFADIGAYNMAYKQVGNLDAGTSPLVFIHGFGGDGNSWIFNLDAVALDRPVFVIDLPGHGRSSKQVGDGSVETLAKVVIGFINFIGGEATHLVGHSLGGAVAAHVAKLEGDKVKSLMLVAPAGLSDNINEGFLNTFSTANSRGELKPAMLMLFQDKAQITRDLLNDTLKSLRIDGAREALSLIRKACFQGGKQINRYEEVLADCTYPIKIIVGEFDEIVQVPEDLGLSQIEGAGHMPHMEKFAEFNILLEAHIEKAEEH
ncbi:MAG: acetoin dehydrogenase dihydrolipoyllysine-residue acetyltransferase subunit [Parvibaculaceae bacterium]|nr:acetoin dehydrogenase dihydrolipoyllysine-residue acetyltransferase subunit [Parvibaculaceae bacterium]